MYFLMQVRINDIIIINVLFCVGDWSSHHCTQPEAILHTSVFKNQTKQDDGDVFWWIFGYVSLLKLKNMLKMKIVKLEIYVKDDNR